MRSKAWLAASVWLRLARLPPPASRVRCSRRLRDKLAAAPGLLVHASVTETVRVCPVGPKLRYTAVQKHMNSHSALAGQSRGSTHSAYSTCCKNARRPAAFPKCVPPPSHGAHVCRSKPAGLRVQAILSTGTDGAADLSALASASEAAATN